MSTRKLIMVYTDGACTNNGNEGARAGVGIYFPNGEISSIGKEVTTRYQTNQAAELYAIYLAVRRIDKKYGLDNVTVILKTDSIYSIKCLTQWIKKWKKNGWVTTANKPVQNKKLIRAIDSIISGKQVSLRHVPAHTGGSDPDSVYNAEADLLATSAINDEY